MGVYALEIQLKVRTCQRLNLLKLPRPFEIHFYIVNEFGSSSRSEMWNRVTDYLDAKLSPGGDIGFSLGVSVRTFDQVAKGGSSSIPEGYVEEEVLLGSGTAG
jgi:hypothetical protein